MTQPLDSLPARLGRLATAINEGKKRSVMDAALVVKDEFIAGPKRSGLKPTSKLNGRRWSAGFNIKGTTNPTALVRYRGPLQWLEGGTDKHPIPASGRGPRGRRARLRRVADGQTLRDNRSGRPLAVVYDGKVRTTAWHPGTNARPFFKDVKRKSSEAALETIRAGVRRNIIETAIDR